MYTASWLGGVKDLDPIPASLFDDGMGKWLGSLSQEEIDHMSLLHPHADLKKCPWCNEQEVISVNRRKND